MTGPAINPNSARQRILACLRESPATANEIAAVLEMDNQIVCAHIHSMKVRYSLVKIGKKRETKRGKDSDIWGMG